MPDLDRLGVMPVVSREEVATMRAAVAELNLSEEMIAYIVSLVRATRTHARFLHGASPRAANMLATASRALAALRGRD